MKESSGTCILTVSRPGKKSGSEVCWEARLTGCLRTPACNRALLCRTAATCRLRFLEPRPDGAALGTAVWPAALGVVWVRVQCPAHPGPLGHTVIGHHCCPWPGRSPVDKTKWARDLSPSPRSWETPFCSLEQTSLDTGGQRESNPICFQVPLAYFSMSTPL